MQNLLSQIHALLTDVILPQLEGIQAGQAVQRVQTECLNRNIEEFRAEMQMRFSELRAEIAACRQEMEDAMVTLRESDTADLSEAPQGLKKRFVH